MADSGFVAGSKEDKICGEEFLVLYDADVSDLYLAPF